MLIGIRPRPRCDWPPENPARRNCHTLRQSPGHVVCVPHDCLNDGEGQHHRLHHGSVHPSAYARRLGGVGRFARRGCVATSEAIKATGTDNYRTAGSAGARHQKRLHLERKAVLSHASCDDEARDTAGSAGINKLSVLSPQSDPVQHGATVNENGLGGTRTHDQRLKTPMLYQRSYAVESGRRVL